MIGRPSTLQMRNALKFATRSALFAAGDAAALVRDKIVRVGETALSYCHSAKEEHADRFVALDTALDLDFAAGEPIHARALAGAQNYRLEPMDAPISDLPVCDRTIARLGRAVSEAEACLYQANDDGEISATEALTADALLAVVERKVADMRARLMRNALPAKGAGE
ncbi:hypothetical protein [Aureimonas mangrovi]|uniref:hypothetical protein n=1 Tax=Aureimonas mangrovi TaxID=2758041 RepID=UPI00163DAEAB|nr:hypothetical protein [Aureimonas mangrovi]